MHLACSCSEMRQMAISRNSTSRPEYFPHLDGSELHLVPEGVEYIRRHVEALSQEGYDGAVEQQQSLGVFGAEVDVPVLGRIFLQLVELVQHPAERICLYMHHGM